MCADNVTVFQAEESHLAVSLYSKVAGTFVTDLGMTYRYSPDQGTRTRNTCNIKTSLFGVNSLRGS